MTMPNAKDRAADKIRKNLFKPTSEVRDQFSEMELERKKRIMLAVTFKLDDPIMPVEEMRWLKKRRAILNYGDGFGHGHATESDMDCLTQEERDRLEAIEIQVRWDQFLGRPKGVDVRPGRYYP